MIDRGKKIMLKLCLLSVFLVLATLLVSLLFFRDTVVPPAPWLHRMTYEEWSWYVEYAPQPTSAENGMLAFSVLLTYFSCPVMGIGFCILLFSKKSFSPLGLSRKIGIPLAGLTALTVCVCGLRRYAGPFYLYMTLLPLTLFSLTFLTLCLARTYALNRRAVL